MSESNDRQSVGEQQTPQARSRRRFLTGALTGVLLGSMLAGGVSLRAAQEKKDDKKSCCEATVEAGKQCKHQCCVKAAEDGKVCEKCHPKKEEKKAQQ